MAQFNMTANSTLTEMQNSTPIVIHNLTLDQTTLTPSSNSTGQDTGELTLVAKITISLMAISMLVIVTGNLLVLIAVFTFSTLRDISSIFIVNLAMADLITGLSLPFQMVFFFYPVLEQYKHVCIIRYTVILFACNASIFSLACTVMDRFVAISFPLRYALIMTERKVYTMIAVIWTVDLLYCMLPAVVLNEFDRSPFCLYEFVITPEYRRFNAILGVSFGVFMFLVYIRIFVIARGHAKRIQTEETQHGVQQAASKHQSYVVTALVVLFFQISWLPFFFVQLSMYDNSDVTELKVIVANFCVFLGIMNSTVNPFIYAWKNKQFRHAFKRILRLKLQDDFNQTSLSTA